MINVIFLFFIVRVRFDIGFFNLQPSELMNVGSAFFPWTHCIILYKMTKKFRRSCIMFLGWLKGLLARFLLWLGLTCIIYAFWLFGSEKNGTFTLIVGSTLILAGSYFRYVSKQTVKTTKD